MFRNYLKTAWRNILRNRSTTLINLFGLSVALTSFIFITLWVQNELSFDNYHKDAKDIYLVKMNFSKQGEASPITALPLANTLRANRSVMFAARMVRAEKVVKSSNELFNIKSTAIVDSNWFNIFDYKVMEGDLNAFNRNPFSLILTKSKATQLFGNKEAIGQTVKIDTNLYQVRAIVRDNPINSSLQFDMFIPMSARLSEPGRIERDNWGNASYRTFIKLYPNTNIVTFPNSATRLVRDASLQKEASVVIQPLSELHFDIDSIDNAFRRGSHASVYIFSVLSILLLLTVSVNYINLTIAKANARTKEISIRQIIGGTRTQLFFQFLMESFLMSLLALLVSVVVLCFALPMFDRFTETNFQLSITSPLLWSVLLGTLFCATLINGIFPALTMVYYKPLGFLHGYTLLKYRNIVVRKGLVVFQFVIGVVLIIGTIVMFMQMHLAQRSAAQYARAQVVSFNLPLVTMEKMDYDAQKIHLFCQTIQNNLLRNGNIQEASLASSSIEGDMNSTGAHGYSWFGKDTNLDFSFARISLTPEAKKIFNFQLKEGKWFGHDNEDMKNVILNETAVKEMKLKAPIVGQLFSKNGGDTGRIVGVIKDYAFSSLYNKIGPMVISNNDDDIRGTFFVKIAAGKIPDALSSLKSVWNKFIPDAPLEYQFMDQSFDDLYKNDLKISKLFLLFSCITIVISLLGLFGLATFISEQRMKEIGIRKVFGASVKEITILLSFDFMKLVILSIIIAIPIALWGAHKWLGNFAYGIILDWKIFLFTGILVLIIAFLTISSRTIRSAKANPVKSLRAE